METLRHPLATLASNFGRRFGGKKESLYDRSEQSARKPISKDFLRAIRMVQGEEETCVGGLSALLAYRDS